MNEITKVSDIAVSDLIEYLHLDEVTQEEQNTLNALLSVAKTFIASYTGRDDLDAFQDFVIVTLILVQDMWDNRTMYVDGGNMSFVVETILNMHSVNLL